MRHAFELDGQEHEVWLAHGPRGFRLRTFAPAPATSAADPGTPVALDLREDGTGLLTIDGRQHAVTVIADGDAVHVFFDGAAWTLTHRHPLARAAAAGHHGGDDEARAPMPGTVVSVGTAPGAVVRRGDALMVIESMKLETTITAPRDGTVAAVHVAPGQVFDRDATLVSLAPDA